MSDFNSSPQGSAARLLWTRSPQFQESSPSPWLLLTIIPLVLAQWLTTGAAIDAVWPMVPTAWKQFSWTYGYIGHFIQALVAVGLIVALRPWFPSTFGVALPRGPGYVGIAVLVGCILGPLMLVVDYWPELLAHRVPAGPYGIAMSNMLPWLAMQGIFVGFTEEIVFRGLFLGYLLTLYPRRIVIGRFDVSLAAILTAVVFALAHADSFSREPFAMAFGQQIYVIASGIFFGWLMEKSGSLLAPVIAHNVGDVIEWGACFALQALWGTN